MEKVNIIELFRTFTLSGTEIWLSEEGWLRYEQLLQEALSFPIEAVQEVDGMTA